MKPLTSREGLIYFALSWAPDDHALAAMACKESEWDAREREFKTPAGRPRIISLNGQERLLDDAQAEAPPVWSPDSSKVATAFGVDVGVYDGASKAPTQARIKLQDNMIGASIAYEERISANTRTGKPTDKPGTEPVRSQNPESHFSLNPVVRLDWVTPDSLYIETAYVRIPPKEAYTWKRWHLLTLSPQAAVLGRG